MQTVSFLDDLRNMPTEVDRFWARVSKGAADECWPISSHGSKMLNSYGRLKIGGELIGTHRIAWALANDRDPHGLLIRHDCDNPGCCNPAHLLIGTHADNARDKMGRKRWRGGDQAGEANPRAVLAAKEIAQIIKAFDVGESNVSIAKRYRVTHSMISRIATAKAWIPEAAAAGWEPAIKALTAPLPRSKNTHGGKNG